MSSLPLVMNLYGTQEKIHFVEAQLALQILGGRYSSKAAEEVAPLSPMLVHVSSLPSWIWTWVTRVTGSYTNHYTNDKLSQHEHLSIFTLLTRYLRHYAPERTYPSVKRYLSCPHAAVEIIEQSQSTEFSTHDYYTYNVFEIFIDDSQF